MSWPPVAGATSYDIERTPVGADDVATGPAAIVGVWRPNRTLTPEAPTFADAGFNPGDRYQWRVRASGQPFSASVSATTNPPWGDPAYRTQWETTQAAQYTSDAAEYEYTVALDAASERVRVVEIGRTVLGRPINMFVIGYPKAPRTARAVARGTAAQFSGPQPDGRPVGERLAAHGIRVLRKRGRYWVPMRQPQRGLIPLLLDGEAAEPMVAAQRVTC